MDTTPLYGDYCCAMWENNEIYRNVIRECGLSECAFWILYLLRTEDGPVTQCSIGASLHSPKQTINSAMKNLESSGYLRQEPVENSRCKQVILTEAGEALVRRTVDRVIQAERDAFLALTDGEAELFVRSFRSYNAALSKLFDSIGGTK